MSVKETYTARKRKKKPFQIIGPIELMEKQSDDLGLEMAPRNDGDKTERNQSQAEVLKQETMDSDIEEIEAVNDSLDSLSSALDFIEKRTDDIKAQLLELLNSNREIRQSFTNANKQESCNE